MDSPSGLERPTSAEGTSIRPNPFDDADASSRKRRRTGSPTGEGSPVPLLNDPSEKPNDFSLHTSSNAPLSSNTERAPRRQPSSSKVTLNLRQTSTGSASTDTSSSDSETLHDAYHPAEDGSNAAHHSVETAVDEYSPSAKDQARAVTPPSCRNSASPNVISVHDSYENQEAIMSSSFQLPELEAGAPIPDFPFSTTSNELIDTLRQVINHIAMQSTFPTDVLAAVNAWLGTFVPLLQKEDDRAMLHIWKHTRFWHNLPELMHIITSQMLTTPILASADTQVLIGDFYLSLTLLTACFVVLDHNNLVKFSSLPDHSSTPCPELYAADYLYQLQNVFAFELPHARRREVSMAAEIAGPRQELAHLLLGVFHQQIGRSWEKLLTLAEVTTSLLPTLPKLNSQLGPICQVLQGLANYALGLEQAGNPANTTTKPLEAIYDFWQLLTASITVTIEKRVSHLTTDNASAQLVSLREVLRTYLAGRPSLATEKYHDLDGCETHPSSSVDAEIVAWEWFFDRMGQLIRSSQMQLRVFGAATMCGSLVTLWKSFSDFAAEDEADRLRNRIGSYILQTNLVDYLFGPSCHPEIIVESGNIVGFLVINKQYTQEHTEMFWRTITTTQDPRVADALCRMVNNIVNLFDYEGLLGICQKLQTLPPTAFTPAIRLLWQNVLKRMTDEARTGNADMTFHPYQMCLQVLKDASICTRDAGITYSDLQQAALFGLREVLDVDHEYTRRRHRQQLYTSCLEDLEAKSDTTLGSLWALLLAMRPAVASEMSILSEDHGFTRLLVGELYQAVQTNREGGTKSSVLCGGLNQPRRELVAQIIQLQPMTLEGKLGTRLWDVLVGHEAASQVDRNAGWDILNSSVRKLTFENRYLSTCFTDRLPTLPRECFCRGLLDFVRAQVLPLTQDPDGAFFEEDSVIGYTGIEQLWRIITDSEDKQLADLAITTLTVDIFIESSLIQTFPVSRTRQLHSSVVERCLELLKASAEILRTPDTFENSDMASDHGANEQIEDARRTFSRTIQLLKTFLAKYRVKPSFALPDLRSFMPEAPSEVEGDLTQLKYQSFDGSNQTEVKPLNIGKLNTAAALLASLRQETGFENYRAYYRGRPFIPTEDDICKSLDSLHVSDGLILVKKETDELNLPSRIKAGSSPLEVEISAHFDELQSYLDLPESMAREVLNLLAMLPADLSFMQIFEDARRTHREVFPPGHAFRILYAVHMMNPYVDAVERATSQREGNFAAETQRSAAFAVQRCITWLSEAISDNSLASTESPGLQSEVLTLLVKQFALFLSRCERSDPSRGPMHPSPERFISFLSQALSHDPPYYVSELVANAFAAIFKLGLANTSTWQKFTCTPGFSDLLRTLILYEPRQDLRQIIAGLIEETVSLEAQNAPANGAENDVPGPLTTYFWETLSSSVNEAEGYAGRSREFFRICTILLERISSGPSKESRAAVLNTMKDLCDLLLSHTSVEEPGRLDAFDVFVPSVTTMMQFCLSVKDIPETPHVLPSNTAANLIKKHLFPQVRATDEDPVPRVIMHHEARQKLCEVVYALVQDDSAALQMVLQVFDDLLPYIVPGSGDASKVPPEMTLTQGEDVYLYDLPFGGFERERHIRASCGYTGLRNLSNTCYLNSLITQLAMNPRFRHFLLNATTGSQSTHSGLLSATKKLLGYMQESWRSWVDPEEFIFTLKTFEESPIDVHSQMDVDEFYNLLFDQWEGDMVSPADKRQLRSYFGGQLVQQVKSKECEHISERLEPFSAIQCDIKGKSNLQASLQAYVNGEILEGDNKYKCSTCDRHVDAVKRACLKDIPDNLIFHLKRFDFNLRTLQRSKINDYFSFPQEIDMAPYTIEHLSDPSRSELDTFELVGVLVHAGTAESGHYYSYIKERPTSAGRPSWLEFNDEAVTQWDLNFLEHATFGGPDYRNPEDPNGFKSYSAYMLFYQRSSTLRNEQQTMTARGEVAPLRVSIDAGLQNYIRNENSVLLRRWCLFDYSHAALVAQCVKKAREADDNSMGLVRMRGTTPDSPTGDLVEQGGHKIQSLALKVALNYFDQVVSRMHGLEHFGLYQAILHDAITDCTECALQLLDYFRQRPEAFRSLLQRNSDVEVRRQSGNLLILSLRKVAEEQSWIYQPASPVTPSTSSKADDKSDAEKSTPQPISIPESMRGILRQIWKGFNTSLRSWPETFGFVLNFAKLGQHETAVLLADDWLLKVFRIIASDPAIETRPNYLRMLQTLSRRSRPPSYSAIIALIEYLLEAMEPVIDAGSIVEEASERLGMSEAPFPWTSVEVNLLLHHHNCPKGSLFLEKLVTLEQNPRAVSQILCRLTEAGPVMDTAVFVTLKANIPGDATAPLMNPFLMAASCYVKNTEYLDHAQQLVFHVAFQSQHLQHGEGLALVEFFKTIMEGGFVRSAHEKKIQQLALENVPGWTPALLVSFEPVVRQAVSMFLETYIFGAYKVFREEAAMDDDESDEGPESAETRLRHVGQNLGVHCLAFLRDSHVKPQAQISKDAAESIVHVITACREFCAADGSDSDMEHAATYRELLTEIQPLLPALIVDEVEADVSEWEGSAASSEVGLARDITDVA